MIPISQPSQSWRLPSAATKGFENDGKRWVWMGKRKVTAGGLSFLNEAKQELLDRRRRRREGGRGGGHPANWDTAATAATTRVLTRKKSTVREATFAPRPTDGRMWQKINWVLSFESELFRNVSPQEVFMGLQFSLPPFEIIWYVKYYYACDDGKYCQTWQTSFFFSLRLVEFWQFLSWGIQSVSSSP